jgi:hypothetical protein
VEFKKNLIALIIGKFAIIPKSFIKYVNDIFWKHDMKEVYKTAIQGTAHIFRKVLMQTYKTSIMVNNITDTTYCNRRISVTLYTTETRFVPSV